MMGRTVEVVGLDERIVEAIKQIRAEFRACTARQLASTLGYHHTYISARLQKLQQRGLVGFDARVPGSIHTTDTTETLIDGAMIEPAAPALRVADRTPDQVRLGVDPAKIEAHRARQAAEAAAAALGVPVAPTASDVAPPTTKPPARRRKR